MLESMFCCYSYSVKMEEQKKNTHIILLTRQIASYILSMIVFYLLDIYDLIINFSNGNRMNRTTIRYEIHNMDEIWKVKHIWTLTTINYVSLCFFFVFFFLLLYVWKFHCVMYRLSYSDIYRNAKRQVSNLFYGCKRE